ncbi:hypothetical protein [Baekduia sp. Peel2402]|uniref:hypothetical protein n=1 Tax=Baekduia sp. Peel2402 TaxID=3458296 RepID=UPI00403EA779
MPRLTIERFDPPTSSRASRIRSWAGARAADQLGERHVWCASASPRGRGDARALQERLRAGGGLDAAALDVDAWLRDLAQQLVRADDLVIVFDAAAALAAEALRARGAHVVWCVDPTAADALHRSTGDVDAYIFSSVRREPAGQVVRHVAALMPGADLLAAKQVLDPGPGDMLGWRSALADVVTDDHEQHVGGRRHVRPAVAAR